MTERVTIKYDFIIGDVNEAGESEMECGVSFDANGTTATPNHFVNVMMTTATFLTDTVTCTCRRCSAFISMCEEIKTRVIEIEKLPKGDDFDNDSIGKVAGHA